MEVILKLLYFNYHTFSFIFSYLHNNQSIVKTIETTTELSKLNLDNSWYYGIKLLLTTQLRQSQDPSLPFLLRKKF